MVGQKRLEGRLPHHAIARDLGISDLGIEPRLHPRGVRLPEWLRKGRGGACKRLKRTSNLPRGPAVPSGADPADIDKPALLAPCEAKL